MVSRLSKATDALDDFLNGDIEYLSGLFPSDADARNVPASHSFRSLIDSLASLKDERKKLLDLEKCCLESANIVCTHVLFCSVRHTNLRFSFEQSIINVSTDNLAYSSCYV